ncbi:competence protein CoiA family protein [Acidiluteibacter ferrifornacis]|uniref:Competence protein CoiA nuclease-like domain-containing protein n=1 Tax=Acidiluteibacter ferrifornacis TaxID=2692424 RepID=A0A6N9NFG3_9FLAO|nr:competence protein CoiA family protein [Acidiluteibacter ferrifornacis]NBG64522.1 hypothetical protein [Acidiluteibacter ferrifornacis]
MLTSIRYSDNKKVLGAEIIKDKSAKYSCEYCKKETIHHKSESQVRIGHFKHKQGASHCPNQTKETQWHFKTKYDILAYITNGWGNKLKHIEVEKWICNNSIRSDLYIETSKNKIAIEVQASILTASEIKRRTDKYYKNGIAVMWILPYDYDRIFEPKYLGSHYSDEDNNRMWKREKVKLKEMEIWLYWANYKKLIFWDLEHQHSDGFTVVEFSEYKSESVDFRKDGMDHYYEGKTSKTIKTVSKVTNNIPFDKLKISFCKEFNAPYRSYTIPKRKIFTYDDGEWKNKNGR